MKTIRKSNFLKASVSFSIGLILAISGLSVTATDTTPPQISVEYFEVPSYVGPLSDVDILIDCHVTDNVAVDDVRLVITGPDGFYFNESMGLLGTNYYEGSIYPLPSYGTYASHVWAVDTSTNQAVSDTYYSFIFENPIPIVHVQSNAPFPWDGSVAHPFPTISMGLGLVQAYGTVFIHAGMYREYFNAKNVSIIGDNENSVIIDGCGYDYVVRIAPSSTVNISRVTVQNSSGLYDAGIFIDTLYTIPLRVNVRYCNIRNNNRGINFVGACHETVTYCNITNNSEGIHFEYYTGQITNKILTNCNIYENTNGIYLTNSINNSLYHNNFVNNNHHIASVGGPYTNFWDDGTTGNYWDTYRAHYPNAHVVPATGTWDTPYLINASDNHPWVYPNGFIDSIPPVVIVTSPNGGETLNGQTTIIWTASDDLTSNLNGTVGISYSADAGSTWHSIAQHQSNSGSYVWDTNSVADGSQYLIKVNASDEFQNLGSDVSNGVFTISNNQAPNIPRRPTGVTHGYVGTAYTFTSNTTDPDNDPVYYLWNWGDGNMSDWMGPYTSGIIVNATHIWGSAGTYKIKVKAKDTSSVEADWSEELQVTITEQPRFEITLIKGGFGVSAIIKNNGPIDATNVAWSIVLDDGFILKGNETTGTIDSLVAGAEQTIKSGLIIGLGRTVITVHATCDEESEVTRTADGFVFVVFVIGVR
jgi:parallel beta-helix repeat protein